MVLYSLQQSCILCLGWGTILYSSTVSSVQVGELYYIVVLYPLFRLGNYISGWSCIPCLGWGTILFSSPVSSVQVGELYYIEVLYPLFRLGNYTIQKSCILCLGWGTILYSSPVSSVQVGELYYLVVLYPMFRLGNYIIGWSCIKCTSRNQFTDHYKEGMRICLWKKGKVILYFIAWKRLLLKINSKTRFLGHIFRIYLMDKSVLMELKKEKIPARSEIQLILVNLNS